MGEQFHMPYILQYEETLDITPWCADDTTGHLVYDLVGIVEHVPDHLNQNIYDMTTGHYTEHVRIDLSNWVIADDGVVKHVIYQCRLNIIHPNYLLPFPRTHNTPQGVKTTFGGFLPPCGALLYVPPPQTEICTNLHHKKKIFLASFHTGIALLCELTVVCLDKRGPCKSLCTNQKTNCHS